MLRKYATQNLISVYARVLRLCAVLFVRHGKHIIKFTPKIYRRTSPQCSQARYSLESSASGG